MEKGNQQSYELLEKYWWAFNYLCVDFEKGGQDRDLDDGLGSLLEVEDCFSSGGPHLSLDSICINDMAYPTPLLYGSSTIYALWPLYRIIIIEWKAYPTI